MKSLTTEEFMQKSVEEPLVYCGHCGSRMNIMEYFEEFPHPNRAHPCNSCSYLWEPDSSVPGDLNVEVLGVLVFCHNNYDNQNKCCLDRQKEV